MMQKIILFLAVSIMAAAQVSFFPNLAPQKSAPDVLLMLVLFWTIRRGFENIWPRIVLAGLVLDALTFGRFGWNVLIFTVASFAVDSLSKRFLSFQKPLAIAVTAGFVVFATLVNWIFSAVSVLASAHLSGLGHTLSFADVFYGLFLKIPYNLMIFFILQWFSSKFGWYFRPASSKLGLEGQGGRF